MLIFWCIKWFQRLILNFIVSLAGASLSFRCRLGEFHYITGPDIPVLLSIVDFTVWSLLVFPIHDIIKSIANPVEISFVLLNFGSSRGIERLEVWNNANESRQWNHRHEWFRLIVCGFGQQHKGGWDHMLGYEHIMRLLWLNEGGWLRLRGIISYFLYLIHYFILCFTICNPTK